ncbi:hypothetical protein EGK14_11030 [Erwinia sp. 198]|nr:hypothetical protein EGK14_11030 [Erwinia sp. 198]
MTCMILHAECGTKNIPSAHARRGFDRFMHLHKKRCTKRAGEAGVALRARLFESYYLRLH